MWYGLWIYLDYFNYDVLEVDEMLLFFLHYLHGARKKTFLHGSTKGKKLVFGISLFFSHLQTWSNGGSRLLYLSLRASITFSLGFLVCVCVWLFISWFVGCYVFFFSKSALEICLPKFGNNSYFLKKHCFLVRKSEISLCRYLKTEIASDRKHFF